MRTTVYYPFSGCLFLSSTPPIHCKIAMENVFLILGIHRIIKVVVLKRCVKELGTVLVEEAVVWPLSFTAKACMLYFGLGLEYREDVRWDVLK